MAIWQWDLHLLPATSEGAPTSVADSDHRDDLVEHAWRARAVPQEELDVISTILEEQPDKAGHRNWGAADLDHRVAAFVSSDAKIESVYIRVDARTRPKEFLSWIVAFASRLNCSFIDDKLRILQAEEGTIFAAFEKSASVRFVADPRGFIDSKGRSE